MTIRRRRIGIHAGPIVLLACAALVMVACATATSQRPPSPMASPATAPATAAPTTSAPPTAREIIAALKAYEARVGFAPTGNFAAASTEAFPGRCYYTGTLELPDSYRGLHVVPAASGKCPVDDTQFDVFAYALETAATGSAAITPALEGATLERLLMVVPHEDFHNQPEAQRAPPALAEAAAMLAGFVTAAGFARERYGIDAASANPSVTPSERAVVEHLAAEAELFARKAGIVNGYYDEVSALYAAYRESRVGKEDALAQKTLLFRQLGQACLNSGARPVSFNRCPAVLNNAGLAFDRTYTREYQLLYAQVQRHLRDEAALVKALRDILRASAGR